MLKLDVAEISRPIQTESQDSLNGDVTLIIDGPSSLFLALVDGAGHGYSAHKVAQMAINILAEEINHHSLCDLLLLLHQSLKGTVGGVACLSRIDKETGLLTCAGIGNNTLRLFKPESRRLVTLGGVLGYEIANPKLHEVQLNPGNVLMMHSDGILNQFESDDFPDFATLSAEKIARMTIDYFSKPLDDASIIVLKVRND